MRRSNYSLAISLLFAALATIPSPASAQAGRGGISAGRPVLIAAPTGGHLPRIISTVPGGPFRFRAPFAGGFACGSFFDGGFCMRRPFFAQPPFFGQPFIFGFPLTFGPPFFFGQPFIFGRPFVGQPFFSPWGWFGGIDAIDVGDEPLMGEQELQQPSSRGSELIVVGGQRGDAAIDVRQVGGDTIQLTRPGSEAGVHQVTLFLADSLHHAIAEQTVTAAPYTASFAPTPATAFIGATVTYANGTIATTIVPYIPVLR